MSCTEVSIKHKSSSISSSAENPCTLLSKLSGAITAAWRKVSSQLDVIQTGRKDTIHIEHGNKRDLDDMLISSISILSPFH